MNLSDVFRYPQLWDGRTPVLSIGNKVAAAVANAATTG